MIMNKQEAPKRKYKTRVVNKERNWLTVMRLIRGRGYDALLERTKDGEAFVKENIGGEAFRVQIPEEMEMETDATVATFVLACLVRKELHSVVLNNNLHNKR